MFRYQMVTIHDQRWGIYPLLLERHHVVLAGKGVPAHDEAKLTGRCYIDDPMFERSALPCRFSFLFVIIFVHQVRSGTMHVHEEVIR